MYCWYCTGNWVKNFEKTDWVFHVAGLADIVPSIKNPVSYFNSNVVSTLNIIQASKKNKVKRIVYLASASCYGLPEEYPTTEKAEIKPEYPYAIAKLMGEQLAMHWVKIYNLPAVSLRLFNVYGTRSRTSGTYGPVIDKNEDFQKADLRKINQVIKITKNMDAVVHFGAIPVEDSIVNITYSILIINNNIIATYNLFEACRKNKVKKVIFASSNHAIGFHKRSKRLDEKSTMRPDTHYGVSKCFGEILARFYADKFNIKSMCIRIGTGLANPTDKRHLSTWISYRGLVHLVDVGLKNNKIHYSIVYGASKNKRSWWNNSHAFKLGYKPKDNAEKYKNTKLSKNEYSDKLALKFQGGIFASKDFIGNINDVYNK